MMYYRKRLINLFLFWCINAKVIDHYRNNRKYDNFSKSFHFNRHKAKNDCAHFGGQLSVFKSTYVDKLVKKDLTNEIGNLKSAHQANKACGNCGDNSECVSNVCKCKTGYKKNIKTLKCEGVNRCNYKPPSCGYQGKCNGNNCTCKPGFHGDASKNGCTDFDECLPEARPVCKEMKGCINVIGSYICHCKEGFNYTSDGCRDIDECAMKTSSCHEKARCKNTAGSYTCTCKKPFTGDGKHCKYKDKNPKGMPPLVKLMLWIMIIVASGSAVCFALRSGHWKGFKFVDIRDLAKTKESDSGSVMDTDNPDYKASDKDDQTYKALDARAVPGQAASIYAATGNQPGGPQFSSPIYANPAGAIYSPIYATMGPSTRPKKSGGIYSMFKGPKGSQKSAPKKKEPTVMYFPESKSTLKTTPSKESLATTYDDDDFEDAK